MKRIPLLLSVLLSIAVSCQKEPVIIPVTGISVSPSEVVLEEGASTFISVTVTPVDATDKSVLWSSSAPSVATVANGTVTALKEGNAEIYASSADGRVKGVCKVKVENPAPVLIVSRKEFTLPSGGGTVTVEVQSNVNVTVKMPSDAPWIKDVSTKALTSSTFTFSVEANPDYDERSASIVFTDADSGLSESVSVLQAQKNAIVISGSQVLVPDEGGSFEIQLSSNVEYDVSIDGDWVTLQPETKGLVQSSHSFVADPLPEDAFVRELNIHFSERGVSLSSTMTVLQQDSSPTISFKDNTVKEICVNNWDRNSDRELSQREAAAVKELRNVFRNNPSITSFEELVYFTGVKSIPRYCFYGDTNLSAVALPDGLESIGELAFYDCNSLKGTLCLPETLTEIGRAAFLNCHSLTGDLNIPDGVTVIPEQCFYRCEGFNGTLRLPKGLTEIGSYAFNRCSGLKGDLSIPDDVTVISEFCFYECTGFNGKLHLPDNLTGLGKSSFSNCSSLTGDLVIPDGVTAIPEWCFYSCSGFNGKIHLPKSLTEIGRYAFYNCTGLTGDLDVPDGVTVIAEFCFHNCSGLDGRLHLPKDLTEMGQFAFDSCTGLTGDLDIPDGVTVIPANCFRNCSGLDGTLRLPKGLAEIGTYAFFRCSGLKGDLVIPDGTTVISEYCFYDCSGLDGILHLPGNLSEIGPYAFFRCSGLKGDLVIPDGVTVIPEYCFYDCKGLDGILHLPGNLSEIGSYAFGSCSSLSRIVIDALSPPGYGDSAFRTVDCLVYVPSGKAQQYQTAPGWDSVKRLITEEGHRPVDFFYASTDYSRDGEVVCLQKATEGKGINIVLMGDGFLDKDMGPGGKYESVMRQWMEQLFVYEPYRSFRNWFTIYTVKVVSKHDEFNYREAERRLTRDDGEGVFGNEISELYEVCTEYAKRIPNPDSQPLRVAVVMNTKTSVGRSHCSMSSSGAFRAWIFESPDRRPTAFSHELGHGFGLLGDEYIEFDKAFPDPSVIASYHSNGWHVNIDWRSDPASVRWAHFLNDPRYANEGLGVFEGGDTYAYGVYRPTENSMMGSDYVKGAVFNAPSRENIYKQIMRFGKGNSWTYKYEDFVAADEAGRRQAAEAYAMNPPKRSAGRYVTRDDDYPPGLPPIILDGPVKEVRVRGDGTITVIR